MTASAVTCISRAVRSICLGLIFGALLLSHDVAAQDDTVPPTQSRQITLTDPSDAGMSLSGILLSFDGTFVRLSTPAGPVTVELAGLTCDGAACPDPDTFRPVLRIAGPLDRTGVLLPALIERYALSLGLGLEVSQTDDGTYFRLTGGAGGEDIQLLSADASVALSWLEQGEVDLALALAEPQGVPAARLRVLALDALVPVVARNNPLTGLSMAEMRAILGGEITDWAELGHPSGGPIDVIASDLPADGWRGLPIAEPQAELEGPVADAVASLRGGFALVRVSEQRLARPLALSGSCGRPIDASPDRLKAEDYPLAAPVVVVLPDRRMSPAVPRFLEFVDSPAAQRVVRRAGYVDQMPDTMPLAQQGQRLANAITAAGRNGAASLVDLRRMVQGLEGAKRLTTTFRFGDGGTELDPQSRGNVDRLARLLVSGRIDGAEMILVGFGDGTGPAAPNRTLSLSRAQAVRSAVQDALTRLAPETETMTLSVQGHGEAMPMGCDDSAWGRQVNRRVEVWLKELSAAGN